MLHLTAEQERVRNAALARYEGHPRARLNRAVGSVMSGRGDVASQAVYWQVPEDDLRRAVAKIRPAEPVGPSLF